MTKGRIAILAICAIVIAVTIWLFVSFNDHMLQYYLIAFAFLLVAEAAFFANLIFHSFSKKDNDRIFSAPGVTAVTIVYLIVTGLLLGFAGRFADHIQALINIQIIAIAVCAVIAIAIFAFSQRFALRDRQAVENETYKSDEPKRGGF